MPAKSRVDWIAIEGVYRAGHKSLREIAADYGLTDGAIRKRAKVEGWIRDPEGAKRQRVKAILAGVGTHDGTQYAVRTIGEQAQQDADDMTLGLHVARRVLRRLADVAEALSDPKDMKVVAEANRIAVETIRRIRGLDEPGEKADVVVKWEGAE